MATMTLPLRVTILLIATTCVLASPLQLQAGLNGLQGDEYSPSTAGEYLSRYLDSRSKAEVGNLDSAHFPRQTRRGLDSLSGVTFGESKRRPSSNALRGSGGFDEIDRSVFDRFVKRNIDEIDRTAFDNFFKRNFDEIDRSGFNGFVKRLDNYFTNRQRRR